MDESIRHENPNPITNANPLSKLFFWWLNPLFRKGYKRRLEIEDMYNVEKEDSSEELGDKLEKEWNKELEKLQTGGNPSLLRAIFRMFGLQYLLLGIVVFIEEGTKVAQPILLGQLIRYFTPESTMSSTEAYMFAMGVSISAIVLAVSHHPYFFEVQRIGMKLRVACCSLLYRKSLKLSNKAMGQTTTGQIVNLMSNDVNRFDTAAMFLHYLWVGPMQAIPVLIILWYELGPATLAGFGVLLLLVPVQSWMGKLFSKLRRKTAVHTDERVKLMNEIISGMRVIKMYCWEKPFGDLIAKVRKLEIKRVKTGSYTRALILGPFFVSVKLIILLTFVTFVYTEQYLSAEKVFVTIGLYQAIRLSTLLFIPFGIQFAAETRVTCKRIQTFLMLEEIEQDLKGSSGLRPKSVNCGANVSNLSAKWNKESEVATLEDISVEVKPGKLLAVIGPVGAGKSSLLMSLLGELPATEGSVTVQGKVSYIAQQPWVFSASLKQNIVFGNKFDKSRYDMVLTACALKKDIDLMPNGDGTLIGDRGVSLSGGQKARVSLARALYMDADIYLLDDPLSAVDTAIGRHLFDKVVQGVLKNKPRILVTHQLHFLKEADEILILKDGKCLGQGSYDKVSNSGIDFSSLLKRPEDENEPERSDFSGKNLMRQMSSHHRDLLSRQTSHHREHHDSFTSHRCHDSDIDIIGSQFSIASIGTEFEAENIQLPEEEERKEGTVGIKIFYEYFKAGAGCFKFIILVFLNILAQATYVGSDWWLSYWSNQEENRYAAIQRDSQLRLEGHNITNVTIPDVDTNLNVYIFSGIIGGVFLFGLLRALMFFKVAVDASMNLHNIMFKRLLRVPVRFFDTNPVGRILNRFSKDTGSMDDLLPITFFDFVQCLLLILGIILVVCVVIPWVLIPLLPIFILFVFTRQYYITTSRHIKRLEGTCRSPVFSHLSASLQGLHTIRAFGVQEKFRTEFDNHQDLHTESWFLFLTANRWLAVRLDWLCALFVTAVSFSCVIVADRLNAGLVGLSMTYAMTLMGMFQWTVRQSAEVENQMISVERVLEYSVLDTEAPLTSSKPPPPHWPQKGAIKAEGAKIRYAEDAPWVFKGLDFIINGQEKIGIVGRTGAGKSSLITMLFRMVEPEGNIYIDDLNIKQIGLHELRNQISIIPQDPVLFTGTLRKNLDPFNEQDDAHLWNALEEVQLKAAVDDLPGQLDSEVSEGGINFSVGQRQLICLARAILRKNKILMIDEATANVDPRTDALIQQTIREKFMQCTVLTIAHRLNTIMDSSRVLVLDEGRIAEFDHPFKLLQMEDGIFYKMVQQTGKSEFEHLLDIARTSYTTNTSSLSDQLDFVHKLNGDIKEKSAIAEQRFTEQDTETSIDIERKDDLHCTDPCEHLLTDDDVMTKDATMSENIEGKKAELGEDHRTKCNDRSDTEDDIDEESKLLDHENELD